jgi:hypothetical protein
MGDVSAKDGSQETLVNLTAVLVGMVLLPVINENVVYTWLLFLVATVCHIYCNYRAVTCLILEQFNYEVRFFFFGSILSPISPRNRPGQSD